MRFFCASDSHLGVDSAPQEILGNVRRHSDCHSRGKSATGTSGLEAKGIANVLQ